MPRIVGFPRSTSIDLSRLGMDDDIVAYWQLTDINLNQFYTLDATAKSTRYIFVDTADMHVPVS